jgi:hypothetical protein
VTSEAPAPRSLHGIVYDRENRSVLVFGGTDSLIDDANFVGREFRDTWVLSSKADEQFLDAAIVIVPAVAAVAVGVFALARTRRLKLR